ncbi:hypothetical protein VaNZ11_014202 [Volvox africanus]|uniref:Uncharacterized protein n=1 Tax=Volvox africanus TaxID=51714 RepID=A0ABQ5SHZ2_9CHLO|nr:hypothetical protein VaNZ11_014202 [Volvox africanus]
MHALHYWTPAFQSGTSLALQQLTPAGDVGMEDDVRQSGSFARLPFNGPHAEVRRSGSERWLGGFLLRRQLPPVTPLSAAADLKHRICEHLCGQATTPSMGCPGPLVVPKRRWWTRRVLGRARRSSCPKRTLFRFPRAFLRSFALRTSFHNTSHHFTSFHITSHHFTSLHSREVCALRGLNRVSVISYSSGTPFATAIACVPPPSTTTSNTATATVNTNTITNTNTFIPTSNSSTTHMGSLTSGLPTNSAKPSSITATPPCCCADDALSAAPVVSPMPTPAVSAAAYLIAASAAAPRTVLGPAATEAATATTVTSAVTSAVTVTAAAVPALQPSYNQALSLPEGLTE